MTTQTLDRNDDTTQRHDLYYGIHKGIRYAHCRLLMRLGSFDHDNDAALAAMIGEIEDHMVLCRGHLEHENHEIHTALESRRPGASHVAEEGHEGHGKSFAELRHLLDALTMAPRDERARAAHAFYRRFALFMADDFEHMNEEETILQPALHEAFDDRELLEIEHRIVAAIPPQEMPLNLVPMIASMHPGERRGMLEGMRAEMPAEAFGGLMETMVRPNVTVSEWEGLAALRA